MPTLPMRSISGHCEANPSRSSAAPRARATRRRLRGCRGAARPAPADAIERVMRFANFHLHLAAPWLAARAENNRIVARATGEEFRFDFAIAGTGYFVDPVARPALADFAENILLWRD